jgi:RNA polymerase sigma factor (sigma-70 family)
VQKTFRRGTVPSRLSYFIHMGTMHIAMGGYGAAIQLGRPWSGERRKRQAPQEPAPARQERAEAKPVPPTIVQERQDLPVTRDARGTLLPPQEGAATLRKTHESAEGDAWQAQPAAAAAPQDAAKLAELDALHRLVYACMQGNSAAWQQLVVSQHRRVYGICYRFTGSPTDAEDLTQDVFLKVYRNLPGFDPEKGAFTTWLTTLTRNLLVDHFRRTRQDRSTDSLDETARDDGEGPTMADRLADARPGQLQHVAQMELRARVQHALKQLSPELREAVILRDLQDMDYKEIAAVLHVPEGTVKSRISRGRAELARTLGRKEGQVM